VAFVDKLDRQTNPQHSRNAARAWNRLDLRKSLGMNGWEAGIRTPIRRSRVCSPTVRRPPNTGRSQNYNSDSLQFNKVLRGRQPLNYFLNRSLLE
jgi:hypothetical protein